MGRQTNGNNRRQETNRNELQRAAQADAELLFAELGSGHDGLSAETADERRRAHGPNTVVRENTVRWWAHLFNAFNNAFILLLLTLAAVAALTKDMTAAVIISTMVVISAILRFFQEYRSSKAAEKLNDLVQTTATVTRSGQKIDIAVEDIVPGDLVHLSAGDMIPADLRLLVTKDLFVSQSSLTGESLPVEKSAVAEAPEAAGLLDHPRLCFMGTNVISGTGTGIVVRTGAVTYLGAIAQKVTGRRVETEFDRGVSRVSRLLIRFTLFMVPVVFLINGFTKGDWAQAFFFALSVAVGLTPEMLPMIVTANLARGAVNMSRKRVIVKKLHSIQNFGAMDVLCSDKTGTRTQDRGILERHLDVFGREYEKVLQLAYLNSYYQTGLKNLLDVAILEHAELEKGLRLATDYHLVDEIPFDFGRRRMSVAVHTPEGQELLITKGAVEEMLRISPWVDVDRQVVPLADELRAGALKMAHALNEEGFRVIDVVTRRICKEVGIDASRILLGQHVGAMSDAELAEAAEHVTVFAKVSPAEKARIIHALKSRGHVVGFLGDGINDAAALREADIGLSVNTAVDIAKESADIILLEKSLMILEEGVLEGRRTFGNILKYIRMGTSSNFGNMFSVLGASAWLPFLPMQPVQLLVQNLLYDLSQAGIPFDQIDEEYLKKPRRWDVGGIGRFMLFLGPVSSIFDYATFCLMWWFFGAKTEGAQSLFQSGWFVEGLLSQTLVVHIIRTRKIPFIESRAAAPLALLTAGVMLTGVVIPFTPFGAALGLRPLPGIYFVWLTLILLGYCSLAHMVKNWYARKYGYY
jgi:Mg2+-importing ATPase